ncbi:MAG: bifunctional isocitrate dehydrogenase kinase/phosphatase [Acidimicrobiia bacterium]|nr:bifunctional isocitrate dehydrogenase kinase/phosphatase [Acidimicrobiia bacterium]
MTQPTLSRSANIGARAIEDALDSYMTEFGAITRRARDRFARREWREMRSDAAKRLGLYRRRIDRLVEEITPLLGDRLHDRMAWAGMKAVYSGRIAGRQDYDIAETFFNSVTRRVFSTVGVDQDIEFVATDFSSPPSQSVGAVHRRVACDTVEAGVDALLEGAGLGVAWQDRARDAALAAERIAERVEAAGWRHPVAALEVVAVPFFRAGGAYLVGRASSTGDLDHVPVVLAIRNGPSGAWVDAVLTEERDVSVLFSYTRSYFHVEVDRPSDLVRFLKSIVPRKRIAELYIAIGFAKHGKTELYRDILDHLEGTEEVFEPTPGTPGMVMAAFGMPSQDLVFKIIRDRFPPPKQTTRREVMDRYRLVSRHDRAGRLIDAWEFEHLAFGRDRFSEEVLDELLSEASRTVEVAGDTVVLHHVYVERRVTPLDVFIRTVDERAAADAVVDMGNAVKDLARSNVFPGDLLLKNFGVTRSGRVVFYDYDELTLLDEVNFRRMPEPTHPEEELAAEPWFGVGDADVFPEEFRNFLGLPRTLRAAFVDAHDDLFDPRTWEAIQQRIAEGEIIQILPYEERRRLRHEAPVAA